MAELLLVMFGDSLLLVVFLGENVCFTNVESQRPCHFRENEVLWLGHHRCLYSARCTGAALKILGQP